MSSQHETPGQTPGLPARETAQPHQRRLAMWIIERVENALFTLAGIAYTVALIGVITSPIGLL